MSNRNTSGSNSSNTDVVCCLSPAEVEDGNKIIAEFMCCEKFEFVDDFDKDLSGVRVNDSVYPFCSLEYHSNWNWLMPVIEKISKIEYDRWENELPFGGTELIIDTAYPRTFGMLNTQGKPMFRYNRSFLFEANTLIEAAWLATVDFIKRENEIMKLNVSER